MSPASHPLPRPSVIARLWAASKINRENNRFYRLGTANCTFITAAPTAHALLVINEGCAIPALPGKFARFDNPWFKSKISRENNRFYRLGTRNSLFLVEWVAWTISVVNRRGSGTSAHVTGAEDYSPTCYIW